VAQHMLICKEQYFPSNAGLRRNRDKSELTELYARLSNPSIAHRLRL
jgi:hypothetical protein